MHPTRRRTLRALGAAVGAATAGSSACSTASARGSRTRPKMRVVLDVAAGETATWTYSHSPKGGFGGEEEEMRLHLLWDDEHITRTVTIEEG